MLGIVGFKNNGFGSLAVNKNISTKELNNTSSDNTPVFDTVSFEGKRHRPITEEERNLKRTLKFIAVKYGFYDFITGQRFKPKDIKEITVDHIVPQSEKRKARENGIKDINGLENLILVSRETNLFRGKKTYKTLYKNHPEYRENGKKALRQLKKINVREGEFFDGSIAIRGKKWARAINRLISSDVGYPAFTGNKVESHAPPDNQIAFGKNDCCKNKEEKAHNKRFKAFMRYNAFNPSAEVKNMRRALKDVAFLLEIPDFYTGKPIKDLRNFDVEHLFPLTRYDQALKKGIAINGLENLVITEKKLNRERRNKSLSAWYEQNPEYLKNSVKAINFIKTIFIPAGAIREGSPAIDGRAWAEGLQKNLTKQLGRQGKILFAGNHHSAEANNEVSSDYIKIRDKKYTSNKFKTLRELIKVKKIPDFYTGDLLDSASIDHVIPVSKREKAKLIGLTGPNSLGNLVLAGLKVNSEIKRDIDIPDLYKQHPAFLENGQNALQVYKTINIKQDELFKGSIEIVGEEWASRLKFTLNTLLKRVAFTGKNNN